MPQSAKPPLSPTVATVFSDFLKKLQAEKITDDEINERLRKTLDDQQLDGRDKTWSQAMTGRLAAP